MTMTYILESIITARTLWVFRISNAGAIPTIEDTSPQYGVNYVIVRIQFPTFLSQYYDVHRLLNSICKYKKYNCNIQIKLHKC